MIRLVVPDGSMQNFVTDLLNRAGLLTGTMDPDTKAGEPTAPELVSIIQFERPQIIPLLVEEGHFDVGIAGQDWMRELSVALPVLLEIPHGRTQAGPVRIVLAVPKVSEYSCVEDLPQSARVTSEYVHITRAYCDEHGRRDIEVRSWPGGTERAIRYGAKAVVDLTETGRQLKANGLRIIDTLMESSKVLVANLSAWTDVRKMPLLKFLAWRLQGAWAAERFVMLVANVPTDLVDKAIEVIGGLKGPTVSPVRGAAGYVAIESCIQRLEEPDISFKLGELGVQDIVITDPRIVTGLRTA